MKELRNRIGITLLGILAYRAGCLIPTPGAERFPVFALGIQPYISASIIMQLLVFVVPALERVQKDEGKEGREKLERWTRFAALAIGAVQALAMCLAHGRSSALAVALLTAGSALVIWLGKTMTERGLGNGTAILITAEIVSRLPAAALTVAYAFELDTLRPAGFIKLAALFAVLVAVVALVVTVDEGVRKIPVTHSRRGGGSSHIPLRVNQGGVMPIIFASSLLMLPGMVLPLDPGHPLFLALELALIVFFAYFYAGLQLDPRELAHALRKQGAFTPGVRAGKPTAELIDRVLSRVTLAGGVFLAAIALVPHAVGLAFGGTLAQLHFGGTSLLIVVGATLETVRQLKAHTATRDYRRLISL
jgi:preprotein translocase subunit SecY